MQESKPQFEKYVFVCINERPEGERVSCGATFCGKELSEKLKDAVKAAGQAKRIRVSKSKCLDVCEEGANVLISPDNLWLSHVEISDIPAILEKLGIKP
jgi:(2Fe-2S) ferredoxin